MLSTESKNQVSVEETLQKFRRSSVGKALVSMEATFSLPVPFKKNGRDFLTVIAYTTQRDVANKTLVINAPHTAYTIGFPDGRLCRSESYDSHPTLGEKSPAANAAIGVFPHPTIASIAPSEYAKRRQQLYRAT